MKHLNLDTIVFKYEDTVIDFRPKAQFYGWGYVAFTVIAAVIMFIILK